MLELKDFVQQQNFDARPWLLLGKGPTFSRRSEFDLASYNKFSLNHVVREESVEIAHIIDIDVVEACADSLVSNCKFLVMPRVPNVKHLPGQYLTLSDWCDVIPALAEVERLGRLVTYDFSHMESDDEWTVVARYFSSEIALGILGRMKVRSVVSLGVDGGKSYSHSFADLQKETLLANGQPSFDMQFDRLAVVSKKLDIEFKPLIEIQKEDSTAEPQQEVSENKKIITLEESGEPLQSQDLAEYVPHNLLQSKLSAPAKVQLMEQEIRELRTNLYATRADLKATVRELGIIKDRLGFARTEIEEYRAHSSNLEKDMHQIVQSKTWKLGRVFTKPAEVLIKKREPKP